MKAEMNTKEYILPIWEKYIETLAKHGVVVKSGDGSTFPLTVDFYREAVRHCNEVRARAMTYEILMPEIGSEAPGVCFMICIWNDGRVDCGSARNICALLAAN